MPLSYVKYIGNSSTKDFSIPFSYYNSNHVFAKINSVTTPFSFLSASQVRFATAPANDADIWIYRVTPRDSLFTVFQDNAGFRQEDLNNLGKQLLYITQEAYDNADLPLLAEWREEFRQGLNDMNAIRTQTETFMNQIATLLTEAENTLDAYTAQKMLVINNATTESLSRITQASVIIDNGVQEITQARQDINLAKTLLQEIDASVRAERTATEAAAQAASESRMEAEAFKNAATVSATNAAACMDATASLASQASTSAEEAKNAAENAAATAATEATNNVITQTQTLLLDTQAARDTAITAAAEATTAKNAANTFLVQTTTKHDETLVFCNEAETFKGIAEDAARNAAMYAQNAFGAAAAAWQTGQTYSFPTVVAAENGYTYRCTGTNVSTKPEADAGNWCLLTIAANTPFELDADGNIIPAIIPVPSSTWDIDENGDIMPKTD